MVADPQTNKQTHKHTNKRAHRQDRLQYTALLSLARSVTTVQQTSFDTFSILKTVKNLCTIGLERVFSSLQNYRATVAYCPVRTSAEGDLKLFQSMTDLQRYSNLLNQNVTTMYISFLVCTRDHTNELPARDDQLVLLYFLVFSQYILLLFKK